MLTAESDIIESPERRRISRRSVALVVGAAVAVALAIAAVALRNEPIKQPTLPGWPAVGAKADDNQLREAAWRAWAARDPSVKLDQTATLFADEWREAQRTVVLLATQGPSDVRLAVVLARGNQAERYSTRSLPADARFITEVIEANGQTAVLTLAPNMRSAVLTTATVGAPRAQEAETKAANGVLLPVAAGQTATRVILKDEQGAVIADRVPGADSSPQTPPAPLILREALEGGRRVQIRSDGGDVTCRVVLADPASEAPALVECPPTT